METVLNMIIIRNNMLLFKGVLHLFFFFSAEGFQAAFQNSKAQPSNGSLAGLRKMACDVRILFHSITNPKFRIYVWGFYPVSSGFEKSLFTNRTRRVIMSSTNRSKYLDRIIYVDRIAKIDQIKNIETELSSMEKDENQAIEISVEQAKLLGSAQRVKIIGALVDTAKTSKQVADEVGESPGSTHYHIQKLYNGGLIDLVETRTVGGIVEKYYKSKAKWFNTQGTQLIDPVLAEDFNAASRTKMSLRLNLSPEEHEHMTAEFKALLEKWVGITSESRAKNTQEYAIGINVISTKSSK